MRNSGLARSVALSLAFLALVLAFVRQANAQGVGGDAPPAAVVLSAPPPRAAPAANPKLEQSADLSPFLGRPITRIDVSLDDDTWTLPELPKIGSVKTGQPLSGYVARLMMEEVLSSGRFARARVAVAANDAGVGVIIHVVQRRLIETLRLDLHGAPVERDEMLREADLVEGGEILGVDIPAYRARIESYLARRGFPTAAVTIESRETDDPTRVLVIVDLQPGGARVLQRRSFYVFGADAQSLRPLLEGYRVGIGQRADESALDAADTAMAARLRALGHHKAEVTHDVVFDAGLVTLRVRADAGPLFEPRFAGNEHYDDTALGGALALDEDTDFAPGHLVQKLRDFYVKRGFLDVEVSLETRGGEADRVHLLVFHIVENPRVKVAARLYPCLKLDEIKKLSGGGPRKPGEIGDEIDSYLEEELPGADLLRDPNPRGLDATITTRDGDVLGTRTVPIDLQPDATFAPDTYDRAALHVQELYRNEGYLHAQVGPVEVLRRRCDARSPPGRCLPVAFTSTPPDECSYDATDLPLPVAPLDPSFTCVPDPAHGNECEPQVTLRIPVKLGPRAVLYDLAFSGARAVSEKRLAAATELVLGEPANVLKLEDARHKLVDLYKEEGFAFVDVKYVLDSSVDHTRARARFDIVEGDRVLVRQIVIRGNDRTNDWTIRRRIALSVGQPYRTSDVRKTQERIATLNVFSNITVALEDPYVPQKSKVVTVTVTERHPQSIEFAPGLSTGEGIRGELDYTHSNIGGDAIGFALRARLSYLPDALILDPVVKQNFDCYGRNQPNNCLPGDSGFSGRRLARRLTATFSFPEIGLGPLVRMQIDGVAVHDLEHDFVLDKYAAIPGLYYRPFRELQVAVSQTFELNNAYIFDGTTIQEYLAAQAASGNSNADLASLLRFPDGPTYAFAQRLTVTLDYRDNTFNPHKGMLFVSGFEHTDWFAEQIETTDCETVDRHSTCTLPEGHTARFTEKLAAYIPVTKSITLAGEIRAGFNVQLVPGSQTYPDRLFFLGGVDSVRGYLQDSMITQEDADRIASDFNKPNTASKFTINDVGLRGGNLMLNPKLELRIPVHPPFDTVLFTDAGNIWHDPNYIFTNGINLRVTAGTGVRIETPIGPLAFDYGVNLSRLFSSPENPRRTYEDFGAFHFAIGLF
jgi:outer membrane protein assembly factor BamA